jgi:hypothetical protein
MTAARPANEISRLSSLLLRHEGPHQLSEEVLLTALIWLGAQYVMNEMTKGLFVPVAKLESAAHKKVRLAKIRGATIGAATPRRDHPLQIRITTSQFKNASPLQVKPHVRIES